MRHTEAPAVPSPRRPRSFRWPLIVVGILGCHLLLMVTVAGIAISDRSFAVLPDYYKRAQEWDRTRSARLKGEALGWTFQIEPQRRIDPLGRRQVAFTLRDSKGQPIAGADLSLSFYHHAHAADVQTASLQEASPGRFVATLPMRYAGFYQFEYTIRRGQDTLAESVQQYVENEASQ